MKLVDALIIPGGESTTMALVAKENGLWDCLKEFISTKPVWGTCAGLILLSSNATHTKTDGQELLGGLAITVERNAFGSQKNSFVTRLNFDNNPQHLYPAMFIRAPVITAIHSTDVQILASLSVEDSKRINHKHDQEVIVAVRQGKILGTSFHPELMEHYTRIHDYFIKMCRQ